MASFAIFLFFLSVYYVLCEYDFINLLIFFGAPTISLNCYSAGHAMWPAIVVDESLIGDYKGLNKISGGRSIPVQFFGTHDFARFVVLLNLHCVQIIL